MGKLVIGQEVNMYPGSTGFGFWTGKVVKITSAVVEVQLDEPIRGESLLRFDKDGRELMVDWYKWTCAPDQHPWILHEVQ